MDQTPDFAVLLPFLAALALALLISGAARADTIELLAGSKVQGEVVARDAHAVTIKTTIGQQAYTRKWPVEKIHAVTINGKREVLNEKAGSGGTSHPGPAGGAGNETRRSRAEIESLIEKVGGTRPDWWDTVPLEYPKTLDLSWPERPPGKWNNQQNVGQYIWDVINTNPAKYRAGVRFMHHVLTVNKDRPQTQLRAMQELGRMYYNLIQDHARAAFWWRKAGADQAGQPRGGVHLAECYWKLGNKQMAVDLLEKLAPQYSIIKLWADMGETRRALQTAELYSRSGSPDLAYLYAGDACRVAGQYQQAMQYYQKVVAVPATGKASKHILRNHKRAQANIDAIQLFDTLDLRRVADGTYQGSSLGYEAPLHVEVAVQKGRIETVKVLEHHEKQYYSAFTDTARKIIEKQSVKGVDATSAATITSEAIVNATAKALNAAMK